MRTYNNGWFMVEVFDEQCYKDEVNLIKVTPLLAKDVNILGTKYVGIRGVPTIVDFSDYIRAYDGGEFVIFAYLNGNPIEESRLTIEYGLVRKGFAPDEVFYPPKQMYYSPTVGDFYLSLFSGSTDVSLQGFDTISQTWGTLGSGTGLQEYDIAAIPRTNITRLRLMYTDCLNAEIEYEGIFAQQFDLPFKDEKSKYCDFYYIDLIPFRCGVKYELLQWTGENGTRKSFWFEKSETIRSWEQIVLLQTLDSNYAPLKNRLRNFTLQMNGLTADEMNYLADICYSDEVYLYRSSGNERVFISEKSIPVSESAGKTQNFKITVNWKKYDTI